MLTANYFTENKLTVDHVLTEEDKKALIQENKDKNYSYLCLLKEMLSYKNRTVADVLHGWSGVQLVTLPEGYTKTKV